MKIACLQFAPILGEVRKNQERASQLLSSYGPGDMDVLVLPEMAFTGYVFRDKDHIMPYVENDESGPTVQWAKTQAVRLHSFVMVGYPQVVKGATDRYYNSVCFVAPSGDTIATYQKSFLYETDERWAEEGPGFKSIYVPNLGKVGFGICMDLNPYRFVSSFNDFEFANFHRAHQTDLILCSMAWLQSEADEEDNSNGGDENEKLEDKYAVTSVKYWCQRLLPLYNGTYVSPPNVPPSSSQREQPSIVFVGCNRTGTENGVTFCGSSTIIKLAPDSCAILGYLHKREEGVIVVETSNS